MKTLFAILATIGLLAGPATAQTPAAIPTPATSPQTSAPAAAKPGSTVSGVTVEALPRKPCAPKDKDCVALVMAQVKELYPEQLKQFCFRENMDVLKANMQANLAGWCDSPTLGAAELCHRHVSQVVQQVCRPDKPAAKDDAKR